MKYHVPVLVDAIVEHLVTDEQAEPIFLDCTLGDGGHTEALLKASEPNGRVIGIDRDSEAIERATARLAKYGDRFQPIKGNFSACPVLTKEIGVDAVDGIVADIGVSSRQFDLAGRGFSFQHKGQLDMRMDREQKETAADLVNEASEQEIAYWLHRYGEERFAKRIAAAICKRREEEPFHDTIDFAETVRKAIPAAHRRSSGKKIDAATKTFQALRIVVNGELVNLERLLEAAPWLLKPQGRLAIMSYHSLEDGMVKQRFRHLAEGDEFALVTKRPLTPSDAEVKKNPRARSAKLRILERIAA